MTQLMLCCVLRFPLKGALVPECLSEYDKEHFYWSSIPGEMLTFMTLNGTEKAAEDIANRSKTAHQFCYIAVPVGDVPIVSVADGPTTRNSKSKQCFLPWTLEALDSYSPKTKGNKRQE